MGSAGMNSEALIHTIIDLPGIVEIFGESGSGKTQLCQYLSAVYLQTQTNKQAFWISVDRAFNPQRFFDFLKKDNNIEASHEIGQRLLVHKELESVALHAFITERLGEIIVKDNVGLLIIDTLAAAFRLNEGPEESTLLFQIATELRKIVSDQKSIVLCTNQVSAYFDETLGAGNYDEIYRKLCVKPALGHSWTNCVNHRFVMEKSGQNLRLLKCVFSPLLSDNWSANVSMIDFSAQ